MTSDRQARDHDAGTQAARRDGGATPAGGVARTSATALPKSARRNGCSTKRYDTAAIAMVAAYMPTSCRSEGASGQASKQDRPVPEVDAVGALTQPAQGPHAEHA